MEPGKKGQFFLRQLWKDPLVKGGKWQLLYLNPAGGIFDPTAPVAPAGDNPQSGSSPSLLNPTQTPTQTPTFPGIGQSADGSGDPTGLPIAGVKSKCKDTPFRSYNEKNDYNEWLFTILDLDPRAAAPPAPPATTGTTGTDPNPH
jgi:hypothetical protein